jgi:hypothetical protein
MLRQLLILTLLISSVHASIFSWKTHSTHSSQKTTNALERFSTDLQSEINTYLILPPKLDVSSLIPEKIPEPKALKRLMSNSKAWEVKKSDFETKEMWQIRQAKKEQELKEKVSLIMLEHEEKIKQRHHLLLKIEQVLKREDIYNGTILDKKSYC